MTQLLGDRAAAAVLALARHPAGLGLTEIARLTGAPLSSTQRTVEALLAEGVMIRTGATRPRCRIAPDVPATALAALARWRLAPARAGAIEQQVAAMADALPAGVPDLARRLADALADPDIEAALAELAQRLIWWEPPAHSLGHPARLVAQAMAIGTTADAALVERTFGVEAMRAILADAAPGVFSPRRWDAWHLRFGYRRTPPLPARPT